MCLFLLLNTMIWTRYLERDIYISSKINWFQIFRHTKFNLVNNKLHFIKLFMFGSISIQFFQGNGYVEKKVIKILSRTLDVNQLNSFNAQTYQPHLVDILKEFIRRVIQQISPQVIMVKNSWRWIQDMFQIIV